jgi:hypothetical protein
MLTYMREVRNAYHILVEEPGGKKPLGKPRHNWDDNIKMGLREIRVDGSGLDLFGS